MIKIFAFSDCHGNYLPKVPKDTDLLIFCGDACWNLDQAEAYKFLHWFYKQPGKKKILVPGNHDYYFENHPHVWINKYKKVFGYDVLGTPYTREFCGWNYMKTEDELREMYSKFPDKVDILISHGAPYGILDEYQNEHIGDKALREYIERVRPALHIFGHIHSKERYINSIGINFHNVSICDHFNVPTKEGTVIKL